MRSGARDHERDTDKKINIPITVRYENKIDAYYGL